MIATLFSFVFGAMALFLCLCWVGIFGAMGYGLYWLVRQALRKAQR